MRWLLVLGCLVLLSCATPYQYTEEQNAFLFLRKVQFCGANTEFLDLTLDGTWDKSITIIKEPCNTDEAEKGIKDAYNPD